MFLFNTSAVQIYFTYDSEESTFAVSKVPKIKEKQRNEEGIYNL